MADFAVDLLKLTSVKESVVVSPLSLVAALSILERGAGGDTQSQIVDALKRKSHNDVPELIRKLAAADGVAMAVATKFFLANGLKIGQQYNDAITKDFNVTAERLDFRDQGLTVKTVNDFVSEATRQMIPSLLSGDFYQPDMRAFLVNAVYFKGQWATRFDPDVTQEDTFHGMNGDRKESFMAIHALKDCRFTVAHGTQVLALPYKDKEYEFVIFLPLESVKFEDFRENLTGAVMKELLEKATKESTGVNVTIPKFKTTSQPQMKQMLQRLGISHLFESGCDLKGVCETEDLFVDDVIHKAVVEDRSHYRPIPSAPPPTLPTVVRDRDRDADTLVVCCAEAVGLLSRDTKENRAAVPSLVYDRLEFTV
ncbi:hypothetical protein Y032_0026g1326 [Ancylostoma ceylanicum]|uniref:Serpin domain-containing protein n=1 Tax=Ancylostoma ceylanicum TaxID=53326 RepID=A0A016UUR6_9BILA|nr:hypothetical protein Y032_0026g1326 [Ancylostoma ceylanicum]